MNTEFQPMFSLVGLSSGELIILLAAMLLFSVILVGGIVLAILLTRNKRELKEPPPLFQPSHGAAAARPVSTECSQCGAKLPSGAPEGLCPSCLLQHGLASEAGAAEQQKTFVPPDVAELTAKFPQLEIIGLIGRGGMGAVYKARQKELDRIVALKLLPPGIGADPAFAERFAREAKALAKLNHPGVVTIHDFGRMDGLYYFVMEYVDGVTLRQLLGAGRVSPREALAIVPQICDALQYAHDQGIVHRDIKPENILIDRRGRVKVADFGLAKLVGAENEPTARTAASSELTSAGKVMGTPNYMAPEQMENPAEVDHRADIYALGVVFYQMLTGQLPGKPIEPPSSKVQIDVRLDEVVLRALQKDPALRYAQAGALKTDVETIAMTEELSGAASPRFPQFSLAENGTIQKLTGLLPASVIEPSRRAALIQTAEKDIVLPLRLLLITILGYYFFFSGWLDTPNVNGGLDPLNEWFIHNAAIIKGCFVTYATLNVFGGAILIWARRLTLAKIEWMVFAAGVLDCILMGTLASMSGGFNSALYWVFVALILRNALAIPAAFPQLLLNFLAIGAFVAGGTLENRINLKSAIMEVEGISQQNPFERIVVLVAWTLCCYGIQMLFEKQMRTEGKTTD